MTDTAAAQRYKRINEIVVAALAIGIALPSGENDTADGFAYCF
jgi:hypothetical protein